MHWRKKIVDSYNLKFIRLDYEIEVKSNDNAEKTYGNISKENLVFNDEEKKKLNNVENGEDNNLKFVGNEEDYLKDILYKIKNIMEEKEKNFEAMGKMIDLNECILK